MTNNNPPKDSAPATPRVISSEKLLGEAREVIIAHMDERYRLRITRQGKLILTK